MHGADASEERVMLDALLPEALAVVAILEIELDGVLVEAVVFRVQFHEELFASKAQLSYFGPGERVDLGVALEDEYAHVGHRQIQLHTLVVLRRMHYDAVQLDLARYIKQIQVRVRWCLPTFESNA